MHPSCIAYYKYIVKIDENRIKCCESKQSVVNQKNDSEDDLNSSFETFVDENDVVSSN